MAAKRFTWREKLIAGQDFISFLKTRNEEHTKSKPELRSLYSEHFVQSITGGGHLPPFRDVIYALVRSGKVQKFDDKIDYLRERPRKARKAAPGTSAQDRQKTVSPRDGQPGARQGSDRKRRITVDQNLHRGPEKITDVSSLPPIVRFEEGFFCCNVCEIRAPTAKQMNNHLGGRKHRRIHLFALLTKHRDYLVSDKDGVKICCEADCDKSGRICFDFEPNQQKTVTLTIHNDSANELLTLHATDMLKRVRVFRLKDGLKVRKTSASCIIEPKDSYEVTVEVHAKHMGTYTVPLAFFLSRESNTDSQTRIVRYLRARCVNALVAELMPTTPYKRPPRVNARSYEREVVEGLLPPSLDNKNQLEYEEKLDKFPVPDSLRSIMNRGLEITDFTPEPVGKRIQDLCMRLKAELTPGTHMDKFHTLLYIEELQMEVDIRKYDIEGAKLEKCSTNHRLLSLRVPGLSENRPSVLKGDHLFITHIDGSSDKEYKGYVHGIELNSVNLGFGESFMRQHVDGMKYNVRFTFGRLPLRVQHRAVNLTEENSLHPLLFPTSESICKEGVMLPLTQPLRLYNAKLESNPEQLAAVKHILCGTSRPAPYVIFGPPGTGKTVTIVEAIKQIIRNIPRSCVLACAPSNSAVDLLTERLLDHLDKGEIFRLNAASRVYSTIPEKIRPCCNYDKKTRDFYYPKKADLQKYRVIVCTLITAGRIASANFPPGHFSHVFVDEAGQAVEPETAVALGNVLEIDINNKFGGQVVLTGDPRQLGPIIRSPYAIKHGLGLSLLERYITKVGVYGRKKDVLKTTDVYDNRIITKLVRNYRSHPAILHLPNEYFYDNELEVHADQLVRECLCQWQHLPKKNFPLIFHGICGEDSREERSPSFFNPQESVVVLEYVEILLQIKAKTVKEADIGIISPYRKQVEKIRKLLQKKKLTGIKVGAVEEFQGQEYKVIIVSTVRSNPDYLSEDLKFNLGFLKNPKRFNVAITRAKSLLVVIGNPFVLSKDRHWNGLLEYCMTNKAYTGCDYNDTEDELKELIQKLESMDITEDEPVGPIEISEVTHELEPEWRAEK